MNKIISFFLIFFCCAFGLHTIIIQAQTTIAQTTLESRVADHVTILRNDSDFSVFDNILKDKRIVILGEAGHQDGTTFGIRSKLTRHLIDDLGFDILGLEAASFIGSQILPDRSEQILGEKFNMRALYFSTIWSNTIECKPIMDAIDRKEIPFFGFDDNNDPGFGPALLNILIGEIFPKYQDTFDFKRFKEIYYRSAILIYTPNPEYRSLPEEDDIYFCKVLNELENLCNKPADLNPEQERLRDILRQSLKYVKAMYAQSKLPRDRTIAFENDYQAVWLANNIRDACMADDIIWYLDRNPDKKMVIWCANFHGARNISQAEYPKLPGFYMRQKLMAEHLAERYGDQLYSLAFTTHRSDNNDSLEAILADSGVDFGFIDFGPLKYSDEFFNKPFKASMIGYKSGCWMSIFDGVFFHKYNRRPTYIDPEYRK